MDKNEKTMDRNAFIYLFIYFLLSSFLGKFKL